MSDISDSCDQYDLDQDPLSEDAVNIGRAKNQSNFDMEFEEFINFSSSDEDTEEFLDFDENIDRVLSEDFPPVKFINEFESYVPKTTLNPDEKLIVDSCQNSQLKKLLVLNRTKRLQLIQLHKYIKDLLLECQHNIEYINGYVDQMKVSLVKINSQSMHTWRVLAPYFKDKNQFPSPYNYDVLRKKQNGELSSYDQVYSAKWSPDECEKLTRGVRISYSHTKQKEYCQRLISLKSYYYKNLGSTDAEESERVMQEINALEAEMAFLRSDTTHIPDVNDDSCNNWNRISDFFLRGKHSPLECMAWWKNYLHPSFNKQEWTRNEDDKLLMIAEKYNYQNWDKIAEDLGTGRSGFAACVHYSSNLSRKSKQSKFTPEEDKLLLSIVKEQKMKNSIDWSEIKFWFPNRSKSQLFHRYNYYLVHAGDNIKKTKFTEAEDVLLLLLIDKFGKNFKKIAEYFPNRTYMQLKNRYHGNLVDDMKKSKWTIAEDESILNYVIEKDDKSWSKLGRLLHRSRGQVRQRYLLLQKYFSKHPNCDLTTVPKRGNNNLEIDTKRQEYIRLIVRKFKNHTSVPNLSYVEKIMMSIPASTIGNVIENKGKQDPYVGDVDSMLVEFFSNDHKMKHEERNNELSYVNAANDIGLILNFLDSGLHIPDNIEQNSYLDEVDIKILNNLKRATKSFTFKMPNSVSTVISLVPPNLNTLVGLRSLLIKHRSFKRDVDRNECEFILSLEQHRDKSNDSAIRAFDVDTTTFEKRFKTLFYWPSILSLLKPQSNVIAAPDCDGRVESESRRPDSSQSQNKIKKRKLMNESMSSVMQVEHR